jgi:hypothetical protein
MSRNNWTLIVVAALLGGLSLYLNRDWFAKDHIQISDRSRPAPGFGVRKPGKLAGDAVTFLFDRKLRLTSVKVIPICDLETNKYPHAVWHLISESNSIPTKEFSYGGHIPGMHSAIKGAAPDPLEPGIKYRLLIEAGTIKCEHDFPTVPPS